MLPPRYLITPSPHPDDSDFATFLSALDASLDGGIGLVQLRAKALCRNTYESLAKRVLACCHRQRAVLLLNADETMVERCGADGQHLSSAALAAATERTPPHGLMRSAATHTLDEIRRAETIGVDFVTLSPVLATATHPDAIPLGWQRFAELCAVTRLPVFALGGMDESTLTNARSCGGHGIAAIRAFWRDAAWPGRVSA